MIHRHHKNKPQPLHQSWRQNLVLLERVSIGVLIFSFYYGALIFFSGFGFSMGGNTMTVSRVVNLVSHLRHIRNLVLPLGKSLGFVGTTFSSVDLQFGQVSMI